MSKTKNLLKYQKIVMDCLMGQYSIGDKGLEDILYKIAEGF